MSRRRNQACLNCGYDLEALRAGVCPECGSRGELAPPAKAKVGWGERLVYTVFIVPVCIAFGALCAWSVVSSDWRVIQLGTPTGMMTDVPSWIGTTVMLLAAYVSFDIAIHELWRVWFGGPEWSRGGFTFYWAWRLLSSRRTKRSQRRR